MSMLHLFNSCFKLQKSYDLEYLDIILNVRSAVKYTIKKISFLSFLFLNSRSHLPIPPKPRQEFEISGLMTEAAIGPGGAYLHANEATQPCCLRSRA